MAKGRKGGNIQKLISILAYGEQGTWKSSIGAEAMALKRPDGKPMRVLFVDSEFGGLDTALEEKALEYGFNLDNAWVVYTESYTEIMGLLDKAKNKEPFYTYDDEGNETLEIVLDADGNQFAPDFIVIDGSTVIYNASSIAKVKFSEKRAKVKAKADKLGTEETLVKVQGADLEFKDYKKLNTEMSQEFILKLISTGIHHYVTAREIDEKEKVKGADGKFENVPTGNKIPEGFKNMGYNVGTVMRLFIDDEFGEVKARIVNKDRTKVFIQNEIVEKPSLLAWQSVLDGNVGKNKVDVNPSFSESIDKEFQKELEENNIVDNADGDLNTAEDYHIKIKGILKSLPADKKKKFTSKSKKI